MMSDSSLHISRVFILFPLIFFQILFFPLISGTSVAEEENPPALEDISAENSARASAEFEKIRSYVEMSLQTETEQALHTENRVRDIERLGKEIETEMNLYEIQLSSHASLLLQPDPPFEALIKAQSQHHAALKKTLEYISDMQGKLSLLTKQQQQAADQYSLNVSQLSVIKNEINGIPTAEQLEKDLKRLIDLIEARKEFLQKIREGYEKTAENLVRMRSRLTQFSEKIEKLIAEKKRQAIFRREKNTVQSLRFSDIREELLAMLPVSADLLSRDWRRILEMDYVPIIAFALFLCIAAISMFRFQSRCRSLNDRLKLAELYPWRHFALCFFSQSLPLTGTFLYLAVYGHILGLTASLSFYRPLVYILYIWLWSRWWLDFISIWNAQKENLIPNPLKSKLTSLLRIVRVFTTSMLLMVWLAGEWSRTVVLLRIGFYIVMLIWCLSFWKKYREIFPLSEEKTVRTRPYQRILICISYLIPFGAIFLELGGFGNMANFWFASWTFSLTSLLWAWLFFCILREWGKKFRDSSLVSSSEKKARSPLQWLAIQFCWLLWGINVLLAAVFAWHPDKSAVISGYFDILSRPLPVTNFHISILSLFYTVTALLVTHAGVRIWRMLLSEKMLAHSGFDMGLKNSITVVSSYLLWFFGILIALNIIGVEGQSLAVAFGGLGIGLGFGLQAVFNNFISGIIMLFERPIQVGDVVEVGGIWGEVRKINVRATEVRTYDYATLIIPNSKMISEQLTNWSFNDRRVRRSVYVRVAYGTDTELVRETLLEIMRNMKQILKYPVPEVLFSDFGDSALLFRLRYYTDVDGCLAADSAVRFETARVFREKGIEIPFPQRDVHLRSAENPVFCAEKAVQI